MEYYDGNHSYWDALDAQEYIDLMVDLMVDDWAAIAAQE